MDGVTRINIRSYFVTSNLTNINHCLQLTKQTLLNVNKTLGKLEAPLYNLLLTRTLDLINRAESIESFINHYTTKKPYYRKNPQIPI